MNYWHTLDFSSLTDYNIWERKAAILRSVWYLTPEERGDLDTHVLLRTSLLSYGDNMFEDEEDHLKDKVKIGVVTYEVCYLNTSATLLMESYTKGVLIDTQHLLLSLRAVNSRNFAVCLIQPRYAAMSSEKYLALREASFT